MTKYNPRAQRLPSAKYIGARCGPCKKTFTHVRNEQEDRHEYVIDVRHIKSVTCPLCNRELDMNESYLFAPVEN